MKDFLVASPRIGFLIALLSLTVISVRQEVGGVHSPCCHKEGVACDLTNLPLARKGEVTLSFFLIGLGAWGASVVCSFGIAVHGFAKSQGLLRRLLEVLVFLSAVVLLVGLIILHKLSLDLATHMDLGVAVWTIASVLFHGKDLCATFSSNFARIAHRHRVVADVRA